MVNWETQINDYLKGEGIPPIKIVYGNKIYPKTKINNRAKASIIEIKSVWVNNENIMVLHRYNKIILLFYYIRINYIS